MANSSMVPLDVVDDLCSRFIINIPQEERSDLIRVCFHIELAHWFYIDYYCTERKELPKCQFKEFARLVFQNVPFLQQHVSKVDSVIDKWRDYKMAVPTYGAILLDKELDNVLLVQGFWARSSWGFPKGKVNADEDPVVCACREVLEETGYDCSSVISPKDYIELHIQDTLIRLYIVTGVDKDTIFKPMTRCEIKNCNWFKISELPMTRKDIVTIQNKALKPSAFFMTIPFIKPLRKWISRRRKHLSLGLGAGGLGSEEAATSGDDLMIGDGVSLIEQVDDPRLVVMAAATPPRAKPAAPVSTPFKITIDSLMNYSSNNNNKSNSSNKIINSIDSIVRQTSKIRTPQQHLHHQKQPQAKQQHRGKQRLWSTTWQNFKLDWDEIVREMNAN